MDAAAVGSAVLHDIGHAVQDPRVDRPGRVGAREPTNAAHFAIPELAVTQV